MKTLHMLRHAKSSWDDPTLADVDRPLNGRGLKACSTMAGAMVESGCEFHNIFCSPAKRARSTIENIAAQLTGSDIRWQIDRDLYTFSAQDLLHWCHQLDDDLDQVMLVGHNPAITDFCNRLNRSGDYVANVPTCGYVRLQIEGVWSELGDNAASLELLLTPKMLR
jgi:phosphohistidine phosphatase